MNPIKQLITLIGTTFILFILFCFLWSPIFGTAFGALTDIANTTIPDDTASVPGANATSYYGHIQLFREVAGMCWIITAIAAVARYITLPEKGGGRGGDINERHQRFTFD